MITTRNANAIDTSLKLTPDVKPLDLGIIKLKFNQPPPSKPYLEIDVHITTPLSINTPPQTQITGYLRSFSLALIDDIIIINVNELSFTSKPNQKIDTKVDFGDNINDAIQFGGDLQFLNELRNAIPSTLFNNGPSVNVSQDGIQLGYTLPIPSVGIGIFSLENIRLIASLDLPFNDKPISFNFAFSERQDPFLISVSFLAGGGFFSLSIGPRGVTMLEASLEFGASASIDLGVG